MTMNMMTRWCISADVEDNDDDEHDVQDLLAGAPPSPSAQFQYPLHNNHIRVSRLKFHSTAPHSLPHNI